MRKQILSLFCLTGFALIYSVARVMADPAEDSDRRFLNNLENGTTQQAAPAKPAPRATTPAAAKTAQSNTAAAQKSAANKSSDSEKTAKRTQKQQQPVAQTTHAPTVAFGGQSDVDNPPNRVQKRVVQDQLAEVAEAGPASAPAPPGTVIERRVTIVRPDADDDHDRDQDDHEHHHHFFHRLFSHIFNNQHPEDW